MDPNEPEGNGDSDERDIGTVEGDNDNGTTEDISEVQEELGDRIDNTEKNNSEKNRKNKGIPDEMARNIQSDIVERNTVVLGKGKDNTDEEAETKIKLLEGKEKLKDISNSGTEQRVITSVLSRQASSSSTDSKRSKKVTFHPSVGDSDQEFNEYIAEYDYPHDNHDVYEGDSFEQEDGEGDETMDHDGTKISGGISSYPAIKRAALFVLRRGDSWEDGEGDGERAGTSDYNDDQTIVDDFNASFGKVHEDSMYPDEYVDDIIDSQEEFIEQLEDVDLPPELEGVDPYLLTSMLEEIQREQDREGSPTGRSSTVNVTDVNQPLKDFIDKVITQILEDAAVGLYEHFQSAVGQVEENIEKGQQVSNLEITPDGGNSGDTEFNDDSLREKVNSSGIGFIEKQNLVQNLQDIISELSEIEKPPSESSFESGALVLDNFDNSLDALPRESTPIQSPEPIGTKVQHKVTLFQAMKEKIQSSFNIAGGGESLFEGDLYHAEENNEAIERLRGGKHDTKLEHETNIDYNYSDSRDASEYYDMSEEVNNTVVEAKPKKQTNEIEYLKQLEIMENISAQADSLSRQILDSVVAILSVSETYNNNMQKSGMEEKSTTETWVEENTVVLSERKRNSGNNIVSCRPNKVAKLDLPVSPLYKGVQDFLKTKDEVLETAKWDISPSEERAVELMDDRIQKVEESENTNQCKTETTRVETEANNQVQSRGNGLDNVDFTAQDKPKTGKTFNKPTQKVKSKFTNESDEFEKTAETQVNLTGEMQQDVYKTEYAQIEQGIHLGPDKSQTRSENKPVLHKKEMNFRTNKYPQLIQQNNENTGQIAAPTMHEQYLVAKANFCQKGPSSQLLSDSKNLAETDDWGDKNIVGIKSEQELCEVKYNSLSGRGLESISSQHSQNRPSLIEKEKSSPGGQQSVLTTYTIEICENRNENSNLRDSNKTEDIGEVELNIREKIKTKKKFDKSVLKVKLVSL